MKTAQLSKDEHALVTVFDEFQVAVDVIERLDQAGVPTHKMELVVHNVNRETPELETPKSHETTLSSLISGMDRWASIGAGTGAAAGILAAVFSPFPGLIFGAIIAAGLTGAFIGGIAGVERASLDDAIDLPTLDEYQKLLKSGHFLVVVLGSHQALESAKEIISQSENVSSHVHPLHGHTFHEHPVHPIRPEG